MCIRQTDRDVGVNLGSARSETQKTEMLMVCVCVFVDCQLTSTRTEGMWG